MNDYENQQIFYRKNYIYLFLSFRYVEAHKIKQRCDFLEKSEIDKHMKIKDENYVDLSLSYKLLFFW